MLKELCDCERENTKYCCFNHFLLRKSSIDNLAFKKIDIETGLEECTWCKKLINDK